MRAAALRKNAISIDRVLQELGLIAFADPRSLFDTDGKPLPVQHIPQSARRALASYALLPNGGVKVRFFDKLQALDRLMRFHGLFERDNAQRMHSMLDDLPREVLKEIEEALLEITRAHNLDPSSRGGGGLTH